jgi:hypothetical protein
MSIALPKPDPAYQETVPCCACRRWHYQMGVG